MNTLATPDASRQIERVDKLDAFHRLHIAQVWSNREALLDHCSDSLESLLHFDWTHLFVVFLEELIQVWNVTRREFTQRTQRSGERSHSAERCRASAKKTPSRVRWFGCTRNGRRSIPNTNVFHG